MLRIIIADDELAARRRIRRLLEAKPAYAIVGEFADGRSAIEGIDELAPDVALLDVQMPERDGIQVAAAVASDGGPAIIFATAFDQYALKAFDVHAVDYLMKPVDAERLYATLARIEARAKSDRPHTLEFAQLARMIQELRGAQGANADSRKRPRDRLLVSNEGRSVLVSAADIDWIEAAGNYVRLHRGNTAHMLRESLNSVEMNLDPNLFARVHRGAMVNISKIREVQPWFSGAAILILTTGQRLTVSRSYRKQFEARFGISTDD